jgi:CHAT domain-containing protein
VAAHFAHPILLSGRAATVAAVERVLPSVGVVHFAGHAAYTADRSALLLAADPSDKRGSFFDAGAVASAGIPPGDLVVLSGCSTGRMRESAFADSTNLVSAFLVSGAGAVVASRWNVDSHATQRLMESFYGALDKAPDSARALAVAEAEIRSRAETAHPYYWSAFTVFGAQ